MCTYLQALVETASETFQLKGPFYESGYCDGTDRSMVEQPDPPDTRTDRIDALTRLPFPDGIARTVVCARALEHVFEPSRAVAEFLRILAPGGVLVAVAEAGYSAQPAASPYWHFTPQAMQRLLGDFAATLVGWQGASGKPGWVLGIGCKTPVAGEFARGTGLFMETIQQRLDAAAARAGWPERLKRTLPNPFQWGHPRQGWRDAHQAQFLVHLPVGGHLHQPWIESPHIENGSRLDLTQ